MLSLFAPGFCIFLIFFALAEESKNVTDPKEAYAAEILKAFEDALPKESWIFVVVVVVVVLFCLLLS